MNEPKVYGFGEVPAKDIDHSVWEFGEWGVYDWSKIHPFYFRQIKEDTAENRLALWEEFAKSFAVIAEGKVVYMRSPPTMTSDNDFAGEVKMVRLDCRCSIAEKVELKDGS